jgi:hypothetical protein
MNKEQQRIKIAEACGYTHVRIVKAIEGPPDIGIGHHPTEPHSVPDYLNDLNAMHVAEKILKLGMRNRYDAELGLIAERDYCFIWETSAAQRAEAFLRTLDSWIE